MAANKEFDMNTYLKTMAMLESNGNPNAKSSTSSARGMYQFLKGTWLDAVKKMGKNFSLDDRYDPKKSQEVAKYFTLKNKSTLENSLKRPVSMTDVYMSHFLGPSGAVDFLKIKDKNPNTIAADLNPKAAKSNRHVYYNKDGSAKTLQELYDYMAGRFDVGLKKVEAGKVPKVVLDIGKNEVEDESLPEEPTITSKGEVIQKGEESVPKPLASGETKDYSDYPFKEAFDMAKNKDKQEVFSWEGRLFTTVTADELLAKASKKEPEEPELPAKDGGVEDIFGGPIETPATRSSRLAQEPPEDTFDISPLKEDRMPSEELGTAKPSKISDILKKTTGSEYDTMSFDKAFARAKAKGEKQFPWKGKSYHTKYKEEM